MITAQDIREKTFEKATFNGYAMSEVDDFLDELADNLVASQKEMQAMRAKMKILVTKIEEYRSTEDAMHMALVTAQKTAKTIEDESQEKADALVAEAQAKADALVAEAQAKADELLSAAQEESDRLTGNIRELREAEEKRLALAREAVSAYFAAMEDFTARENALLAELKEKDMIDEPAPAEETVEELPAEEAPIEEAPIEEEPAEEELVEELPAEEEEPGFDRFSFDNAPAETPELDIPEEDAPASSQRDFLRQFEEAVYSQPEIGIPDAADGDEAPLFRF